MADVETTTSWGNLMREAKGPLVEALKWKTVLLSEIKRDSAQRRWNGKQVTVPMFTAPQQGAGGMTQVGLVNDPYNSDEVQSAITSGIVSIPISFSTQVLQQAKGNENVWAEVMPTKMQRAEDAFGRVINEMMTGGDGGDGAVDTGDNGLLCKIAGATGASGGATQTVNVGAGANLYQLYPGRIVTYVTRTTGVPPAGVPANGVVKITQRNLTTGIITLANPDGVTSLSFASATTEGIYIQGSYGTAIQGLMAAVATAGNFQNLSKTSVPAWQGTDASPGSATDPGLAVWDRAERLSYTNSGRLPRFYMADPAVVDKYTQGLTVQAQWAGEAGQLESGWTGVKYRNKLIVPDYDINPNTAVGISPDDCAIYTLMDGPDWDDYTGAVLQRFGTRSLPVEAWLVWMLQFGFHSCNAFVQVRNLNRAT